MSSPGSAPDLYELLTVSRDATAVAIARAYRMRARALHPDSHPDDAGAADRFRAVTEAYRVLSNPARRAAYDHDLRARPGRRRPVTPASAGSPPAGPPLDPPGGAAAGPVGTARSAAAGPELAEALRLLFGYRNQGWSW